MGRAACSLHLRLLAKGQHWERDGGPPAGCLPPAVQPLLPQVAWLWAAVEQADQGRRAALLAFVTGAASLPAGGFAALRGFNGALHPFTGEQCVRCAACGVVGRGSAQARLFHCCLLPAACCLLPLLCMHVPLPCTPLFTRPCSLACIPAACLVAVEGNDRPFSCPVPVATLPAFGPTPLLPAVCLVAVEGDDRLPRASTCFNTLFLPRYSSAAVLEARLGQALSGDHMFDEGARRRR